MEKVAIVIDSSKGIGFAVVKGLCERFNGLVYITARDEKDGQEAVKKLNSQGLYPRFHMLDVTNESSVRTLADSIKSKHGGFDVLVNNAGILDWDEIYPSYEVAKRNIDVNYRSLLTIEKYLYPLLRDNARVVNVAIDCGHLSNLNNKQWIETLSKSDLKREDIDNFVNDYLESVKNGTFRKEDFADDAKHAEHRVSKVAVVALTNVQQRDYMDRNISINAVHPGHVDIDSTKKGKRSAEDAAKVILYMILDASPNLKGVFMWEDGKLVDWYDVDGDYYCKGLW